MKLWSEMTDNEKRVLLDWVVQTCLVFGVSRSTAYTVAGIFADGLDRKDAPREEKP